MILRTLRIEADQYSEIDLGFHFGWSAYHVKEIFLLHLPRDFRLDGSSLFQISCGSPHLFDEQVYRQCLGSSQLVVKSFNFVEYRLASLEDRQEIILDLIVNSLIEIGTSPGADLEIVRAAAQKVRDAGFRLDIPTKLSRWTANRARRFTVIRKLSLELGEAWVIEISAQNGEVQSTHWITERPGYLDRRGQFKKSCWCGQDFIISDSQGKPVVRLNLRDETVVKWDLPLDQNRIRERYDQIKIDFRQRAETAVAAAGHLFHKGDFHGVVSLLEPYLSYLPPSAANCLAEARRRCAAQLD